MPPSSLPQKEKGAVQIRRFLVPTLAAIIAAAILIGNAPVEAGTRSKMRLGISMTEGSRDISVMDDFRDQTGGQYPAIWTVWSAWGNPNTKKFPSAMVAGIKKRGAVTMVFWEPVKRQGLCTDHSRFRKIAKGKFDKYVKNWARAAKKSKSVILLRFAHEINGRYFPWTIGSCGNTIKQYKAAWKRVYN
ncbi:MAG: glycosyl hydrolase, partial [Chloroflexota bacterium]